MDSVPAPSGCTDPCKSPVLICLNTPPSNEQNQCPSTEDIKPVTPTDLPVLSIRCPDKMQVVDKDEAEKTREAEWSLLPHGEVSQIDGITLGKQTCRLWKEIWAFQARPDDLVIASYPKAGMDRMGEGRWGYVSCAQTPRPHRGSEDGWWRPPLTVRQNDKGPDAFL